MPKAKNHSVEVKVTPEQIQYLKSKMEQLAARNRSWGMAPTDYKTLYQYLAVQKITYLYDDELQASKELFLEQLNRYVKEKRGNEDAALKNSSFAQQVEQAASTGLPIH